MYASAIKYTYIYVPTYIYLRSIRTRREQCRRQCVAYNMQFMGGEVYRNQNEKEKEIMEILFKYLLNLN